jgi:hypothetical protein
VSVLQGLDAPLSVALEALSLLLRLVDVEPQAGPVGVEYGQRSEGKGMVPRLAKDGRGTTFGLPRAAWTDSALGTCSHPSPAGRVV